MKELLEHQMTNDVASTVPNFWSRECFDLESNPWLSTLGTDSLLLDQEGDRLDGLVIRSLPLVREIIDRSGLSPVELY